ncbi:hypothetical protein niasHT_005598 [Heterodera trifolii]|uniref:Gustatory receptor n=1 Tax=Heterodera trifolii TaxID=157864 RepID=A0ABD2M4Y1_9BILA
MDESIGKDGTPNAIGILPKPTFDILCIAIDAVECAFCCPTVVLCFLFWRLIYQTSLLHKNLKFILIAQSIHAFLYAFVQIFSVIYGLFSPMALFFYVNALRYFLLVYGNFIGHLLIAERIVATFCIKKYETVKNWWTLSFCVAIIILLSVLNAYYYSTTAIFVAPNVCFYTQIFAVVTSFSEIFIISLLLALNKRRFNRENSASFNMAIKYQLVENIRTGRQLIIRTQIITDLYLMLIIGRFALFLQGINNLLILFTTIKCHPILCRNALKFVQKYVKCSTATAVVDPSILVASYVTGITQQQIPVNANMDNYFQLLQRSWEI